MSQPSENPPVSRELPPRRVDELTRPGTATSRRSNDPDYQRLKIENDRFKSETKFHEQKRTQAHQFRDDLYATSIRLVLGWSIFLVVVIIGSGLKWFELSDNVIIALVTATLANVFGVFYVVVKYAFRGDER